MSANSFSTSFKLVVGVCGRGGISVCVYVDVVASVYGCRHGGISVWVYVDMVASCGHGGISVWVASVYGCMWHQCMGVCVCVLLNLD